jgi:hypothetical protein
MTRLADDWVAGYYRGKDDHPCDPGANPFPPRTAAHAGWLAGLEAERRWERHEASGKRGLTTKEVIKMGWPRWK